MGIKLLFCILVFTLVCGFVWFTAQVVYLGTREFFSRKKQCSTTEETTKNNKNKKTNN